MKKNLDTDKLCATYRLQLHKDFTFYDAVDIHPYLQELGVSHLYLSPIMESVPGSLHGYDGLDPEKISEERGGEDGFRKLMETMQTAPHLQGVLLDVVCNHLAAHGKNPAWWSVLKEGKESLHWQTFDLRLKTSEEKILLPVLGEDLDEALRLKKGRLIQNGKEIVFQYEEGLYPLNKRSLKDINVKLGNKKSLIEKTLQRMSVQKTKKILNQQYYELVEWKTGSRWINYRRFFDITSLVGVRIEDPKVFKWFHQKIFQLMKDHPVIHGLRIDHIDGLTSPEDYLEHLHSFVRWIWVEKILSEKEALPPDWPVMGSTGYEFANVSSRLFIDLQGLLALHSNYLKNVESRWQRFKECVYESKKEILSLSFVSELTKLAEDFYKNVPATKREYFSIQDLELLLKEISATLRVYRTYAKKDEVLDSAFLKEAFLEAESRDSLINKEALSWLKSVCLQRPLKNQKLWQAVKRWEQLTGPLMAKGLEDTALYRYCPLMSLNSVGGDPDWIGNAAVEYHEFQLQRRSQFKFSLNATSTHDTKRSEDVLMRIHVLSELSKEWEAIFDDFKAVQDLSVDIRSLYMMVETIIGVWPLDGKINKMFISRLQQYFIKAAREAKTETSWLKVNEAYEKTLTEFLDDLLRPQDILRKSLLNRIKSLALKCAYYGAINSLSVLVLKATSYGVPDFYQGSELWDLSLVDPDNRRPVDYQHRKKLLHRLSRIRFLSEDLQKDWPSGEIKLWLTQKLLFLRQKHGAVFLNGDYAPVQILGEYRNHFLSYVRWSQGQWFWIIVPRVIANKEKIKTALTPSNPELMATEFRLPRGAPKSWINILTGKRMRATKNKASDLFDGGFVAILQGQS